MIKVVEVIQRKHQLDVESFQSHWLNDHGPIVAQLPGLRRYVQSHTRLKGYERGSVPYDGIAELWFDDKEALAAIASTGEFAAAKSDEPNFIDTDRLVELVVDDHVIKDGEVPPDAIKSIEFVHLTPSLEPPEAHRYWRDVHGPLAAKIPTMSRYVQSHIRMGAYDRAAKPVFDGMAITWWKDLDAMRASSRAPEYAATRADEPNFLGVQPEVILTTEHIIVG